MHVHIPVGGQLRFALSENWRFGFEGGYRIGFTEYINNLSGVYYPGDNPATPNRTYTDISFTGEIVTLSKENAPVSSLVSSKGRKGYFFGLFALSYRIKS
jgi:hypothetical protein